MWRVSTSCVDVISLLSLLCFLGKMPPPLHLFCYNQTWFDKCIDPRNYSVHQVTSWFVKPNPSSLILFTNRVRSWARAKHSSMALEQHLLMLLSSSVLHTLHWLVSEASNTCCARTANGEWQCIMYKEFWKQPATHSLEIRSYVVSF